MVSTSSEIKGSEGSKAIDSDPTTSWRTNRKGGTYPHEIIIELGEELGLKGFSYTPPQEESISGTIYQFNFYVSEDGENWKKIIDNGAFANIKNNPIKQEVKFNTLHKANYIKLEPFSSVNEEEHWAMVAEIGVLTE